MAIPFALSRASACSTTLIAFSEAGTLFRKSTSPPTKCARALISSFISPPCFSKKKTTAIHGYRGQQYREFVTLKDGLEMCITSIHTAGLPWWSAVAVTTILIRTSLMPLSVWQSKEMVPFGKALPKISLLWRQFRARWAEGDPADGRRRRWLLSQLRQGAGAALEMDRCRPGPILGLPVAQLGLFVYVISSLRGILQGGQLPGLDCGGALWFSDLAAADPTLALPIAALGLTYANLELGFGRFRGHGEKKEDGGLPEKIKSMMQVYLIWSFPFIMQLPAGVFMYWIPSSLFGSCQVVLLRQNPIREMLGLPPIARPFSPPPSTSSLKEKQEEKDQQSGASNKA